MHHEPSAYLRPMLTRGNPRGDRIGKDMATQAGVLRILADVFPDRAGAYRGPIRVVKTILSSYTRTLPNVLDPKIKTLSYTTCIVADFEARERGAEWPIFRDGTGLLTEISGGNIFIVKDGRISTPMAAGVLGGIARRRMIQVARACGYECVETNLTRYDLEQADEAFVTAGVMCMHAIGTFEDVELPGPVPGPVSVELRDAYTQSVIADGTPIPPVPADALPVG
jgi:branched-chain amino acid aminotransferase